MKETKQHNHIHILQGTGVQGLPDELKVKYSQQVSDLLAIHKSTMLQFKAEDVIKIINESRAVIASNSEGICAFIQVFPWVKGNAVEALELRSWISTKPQAGLVVLQAGLQFCDTKFAGIPVYSTVADDNIHAQEKLLSVGGKEVPMPESMGLVLKNEDGFIPVKVFLLKGGEKI